MSCTDDMAHAVHAAGQGTLPQGFRAGLTQDAVAARRGTNKSAVSRLEGFAKHTPSFATWRKYAEAVDCYLQVLLVPQK